MLRAPNREPPHSPAQDHTAVRVGCVVHSNMDEPPASLGALQAALQLRGGCCACIIARADRTGKGEPLTLRGRNDERLKGPRSPREAASDQRLAGALVSADITSNATRSRSARLR